MPATDTFTLTRTVEVALPGAGQVVTTGIAKAETLAQDEGFLSHRVISVTVGQPFQVSSLTGARVPVTVALSVTPVAPTQPPF